MYTVTAGEFLENFHDIFGLQRGAGTNEDFRKGFGRALKCRAQVLIFLYLVNL